MASHAASGAAHRRALVTGGVIADPGDVFFLTRDEALCALNGTDMAATVDIAERRARRDEQGELVAPLMVGRMTRMMEWLWEKMPRLVGAVPSDTALRVGHAGVAGSRDRAGPGSPRPARLRSASAGRDPRGTAHGAGPDAALHPRGRSRDRRRKPRVACLDHRARSARPAWRAIRWRTSPRSSRAIERP